MVLQVIPEAFGNRVFQSLQRLIVELDDFSGLDIDEVIVMLPVGILVARPPVAEIMPADQVQFFEKLQGPVGRWLWKWTDPVAGALLKDKGIGMVDRLLDRFDNDMPRVCHPEPAGKAPFHKSLHLPASPFQCISLTEFNASGSKMFSDLDTNGESVVAETDMTEAY